MRVEMKKALAALIFINRPAFAMSPTLKDIHDRRAKINSTTSRS